MIAAREMAWLSEYTLTILARALKRAGQYSEAERVSAMADELCEIRKRITERENDELERMKR